jgi:MbtH protein
MEPTEDPFTTYVAVTNDDEQYSVWPADLPVPAGWSAVGQPGTKAECLDVVGVLWQDMTPRRVREELAAHLQAGPAAGPDSAAGHDS